MSLFSKADRELPQLLAEQKESQKEIIRRKEFCIQQASFACDERPEDVISIAEKIYEWIYGEKP